MSARPRAFSALLVCLGAHAASPALAQWQHDGVPVCTACAPSAPMIVSDGTGGAIIAWADGRFSPSRLYAQRLDASGVPQWATNGVPLCSTGGPQFEPAAISDGAGGAIVTWIDRRAGNYDIYAQHVDGTGTPTWGAGGVAICTAAGDQTVPAIFSDLRNSALAHPGAIIAWQDARSGTPNIYAQAVDGLGALRWAANGVAVAPVAAAQTNPVITTDGATGLITAPKGAIIAWEDGRASATSGIDVYAQRMSSAGSPQWGATGLAVCTAPGTQQLPAIVFVGFGSAIIAWSDYRNGTGSQDIYAQEVNSGAVQWAANGVPLCSASGAQVSVVLASDGTGGAIAAWEDGRALNDENIFVQRVNGAGSVLWATDGVALCAAAGAQSAPAATAAGAAGAVVAWRDARSGFETDVFAAVVDSFGVPQGNPDGLLLGRLPLDVRPSIVGDGSGGAIVAWCNTAGSGDIYANHIDASGNVTGAAAPPPTTFRVLPAFPNPARSTAAFAVELPATTDLSAEILDLHGRLVRTLAGPRAVPAGRERLSWDGTNQAGRRAPDGVYFLEVRAGAERAVRRVVLIH